ncbi:unnamed protein product [Sphagnum jensenii]|uniref:Uncharacterized protein n=1 Tax=Sphagnum jensenii TaxID=128206 RepID=A0ABP0X3R1_9BRYO
MIGGKLHRGRDKEIADCLIFTLLSAISNAKGHASPRIGRCTWDHALGPYALVVCRRLPVAAETSGRACDNPVVPSSRRDGNSALRKRTKPPKRKRKRNFPKAKLQLIDSGWIYIWTARFSHRSSVPKFHGRVQKSQKLAR